MEEKKIDYNSIIGFVLIFIIFAYMMYRSESNPSKKTAEKATTEQTVAPKAAPINAETPKDSATLAKQKTTLGAFAFGMPAQVSGPTYTVLENDKVILKIANQGGQVIEAQLKGFEKFKKNSGKPVYLVKDQNADFGIQFTTTDNRTLNTRELYFQPSLQKSGNNQVLSLRAATGPNQGLTFEYTLKPNDYMLDFDVSSTGLKSVIADKKPVELQWNMKTYRNEISIPYENRYAEIVYEYEEGKDNYVGQGSDKEETPDQVTYVAFKQHFFTSILLTRTPFDKAVLHSDDLVKDEKKDTLFTKQFRATAPLALHNGELDYKLNWYFGPSDYNLLSSYDRNLDEIIPLGWGIFGWINKYIFFNLFGILGMFLSYGIAIILFTFIIKLAMSPFTFKSFMSQAKMKVLRPEINALNEKFSKDPMKRQQETMKLYSQAGVNPMAGCVPALIQLPFVYASFQFFPSAIELRQKGFLWADDLSSFDEVVHLPFHIPVYGDHISLFPILAAIAIFFYMKMTSGDQAMAAPQQEGMPDMTKMMKAMIYISPVMMLLFFNNYGSGLSLYNFMSNLITIGIMLVIKKYFIDSDKIHAKIQDNKTKPKSESKFQRRMREMMEQAENQKNKNKK
ncbi:MAG: membrane protein insertase YidC [Flavobacterium sp. BFFFF2]|nr:MAG: membrane protein insertase YidC [Flavobacterium sp. BFFFF2]